MVDRQREDGATDCPADPVDDSELGGGVSELCGRRRCLRGDREGNGEHRGPGHLQEEQQLDHDYRLVHADAHKLGGHGQIEQASRQRDPAATVLVDEAAGPGQRDRGAEAEREGEEGCPGGR